MSTDRAAHVEACDSPDGGTDVLRIMRGLPLNTVEFEDFASDIRELRDHIYTAQVPKDYCVRRADF